MHCRSLEYVCVCIFLVALGRTDRRWSKPGSELTKLIDLDYVICMRLT